MPGDRTVESIEQAVEQDHPERQDGEDDGEHGGPSRRSATLAYLASARIAFSSPSSVSGYIRSSTSSRTIPTEAE